jgi:hypothetical protein
MPNSVETITAPQVIEIIDLVKEYMDLILAVIQKRR